MPHQLSSNTGNSKFDPTSRVVALALFIAVLIAAISYSLGPLMVKISSSEDNPFAFNSTMRIGEIAVLTLYLGVTVKMTFGSKAKTRDLVAAALFPSASQDEFTSITFFSNLFRITKSWRVKQYLTSPMFWIILTNPTYLFLAWATAFVDTAVAAVVLETWPLVMIIALTYFGDPNNRTRSASHHIDKTKVFPIALAPVGVALVILGQTNGLQDLMTGNLSRIIGGISLALIAALLAGISPVATICYGHDKLRLTSPNTSPSQDDISTRLKVSWYSVLGLLVADIVHVPIGLVLSMTTFGGTGSMSAEILIWGFAAGALFGLGGILLRIANSSDNNPNRNSLLFLTPILALVWLFWKGVKIPRTDLFLIGAALVIAIIIIVRNDPDQERDTMRYSEAPARGMRLSFMALILSLWAFGTLMLLRDESYLKEHLSWYGGEYWGLMALSATVFALIFGFRTNRLASRVDKEEDTMLRLFRKCEYLAERELLDPQVLGNIRRMYRSGPRSLESAYREARSKLIDHPPQNDQAIDRYAELFEIRSELDILAHSKQRGREFVELIALALLALVTIVLGTGSRPQDLVPLPDLSVNVLWTGFLSEIFVMLFLSTVTFLWLGLFDLHRDRDLPLIVGNDEQQDDEQQAIVPASNREYSIFFRHDENLIFQRVISVLVCLGMCTIFVIVLFDKWMLR